MYLNSSVEPRKDLNSYEPARFLVYKDLQTYKGWAEWKAGRPERKEAV